jgi:hypothetical protein
MANYSKLVEHKLPLTNGLYHKILDENVPDNILNFLDQEISILESQGADNVWNDFTIVSEQETNRVYKQWFMQTEEFKWKNDSYDFIEEYLLQFVEGILDFRFSVTPPGTLVDWHMLHPLPALHLPLQGESCYFELIDGNRSKIQIPVQRGKLYIFNVCFPHRVFNEGNIPRIQAFCGATKLK